jgi:glycolate oxidase FAD binding subunit
MEAMLAELRERVVAAHRDRAALHIRGSRTKDFYGERLVGDVLDVRGYRGIVDYEPSELVLTARCGTPLSEIERALAERGQFLAFEPPAFAGDPTLGGVIAAGLSGPRRMQVGAARDFVLGTTLLSAEGELLSFGGRVMKNVAGFDVSRLLCGSLGILGLITQVSVKVLPLPRAEQTLCLEMSAADAVNAFNRWGGEPLPISAAAWHNGVAWVRLSGAEAALRTACERIGGERVDSTPADTFWNSLRHQTHGFFKSAVIWRASVPSTAHPLGIEGDLLIEWGGALRWYAASNDGGSQRAQSAVEHAQQAVPLHDVSAIRELVKRAGGSAMLWRGDIEGARFHPLAPTVAQIHRRLKERFDPRGIFNPGRLIADL